jgi:heme exporter protein C
MRSRTANLALALLAVTTVAMAVAIWMVFLYAPDERVMGAVQRIFYFHVPSAIVTFLSTFVLLGSSVGYLWTRNQAWDRVSKAATEIGLVFCTIVLVTGPIWARPAWGVWWTWEARLTTTLVLWLLLAAAIMVRRYADDRDLGARLASVFGIIAALDVPIIYKAVDWWRGQHPVVFEAGKKAPLAPKMFHTFMTCMAVFLVLYVVLMILRVAIATVEDRCHAVVEAAAGERS